MSHRISLEEARKKRLHEIECQELNKKGIMPETNESEKKKQRQLSKTEQFVEILSKRGGYFKQKEGKKKEK
jgi:hypothetical protein